MMGNSLEVLVFLEILATQKAPVRRKMIKMSNTDSAGGFLTSLTLRLVEMLTPAGQRTVLQPETLMP